MGSTDYGRLVLQPNRFHDCQCVSGLGFCPARFETEYFAGQCDDKGCNYYLLVATPSLIPAFSPRRRRIFRPLVGIRTTGFAGRLCTKPNVRWLFLLPGEKVRMRADKTPAVTPMPDFQATGQFSRLPSAGCHSDIAERFRAAGWEDRVWAGK